MRIQITILVTLFLLGGIVKADNPGYLGKKTIVNLGLSGMHVLNADLISLFESNATSDSDSSSSKFRLVLDLELERSVSKRFSLLIGHSRYGAEMNQRGWEDAYLNDGGVEFQEFRLKSRLKMRANHIGFKYFNPRRGGISPLGRYFAVRVGQVNYSYENVKLYPTLISFPGFNPPLPNHSESFNYSRWFLNMELGKTRIIKDKIVLNYFVQANFRLTSLDNLEVEGLGSYPTSSDRIQSIGEIVNYNSNANILRAGFKVGYIF